ncbi:hypothetical protein A0H81_07028 [Grifola frondosa]|uniref:Uncharacterized protein n=1 Tax=Grifola frondosa TaxID=5627 RepID=A0A1C7MD14_GRIFR|nr:hypothetical protein A0H81_07028 [Grifola frondosa]
MTVLLASLSKIEVAPGLDSNQTHVAWMIREKLAGQDIRILAAGHVARASHAVSRRALRRQRAHAAQHFPSQRIRTITLRFAPIALLIAPITLLIAITMQFVTVFVVLAAMACSAAAAPAMPLPSPCRRRLALRTVPESRARAGPAVGVTAELIAGMSE